MIIRYAEEKNFIELRQFYDGMCKVLSEKDFLPEGDKGGFPPDEMIKDAIKERNQFIGIEDGRIVAAYIMNHDRDEAYHAVKWLIDANDNETVVLHALRVLPEYGGRGYSKQLVQHAIDTARERNLKSIRLDCIEGNDIPQKMYMSFGFKYVDTVEITYVDIGVPRKFLLYEFVLYHFIDIFPAEANIPHTHRIIDCPEFIRNRWKKTKHNRKWYGQLIRNMHPAHSRRKLTYCCCLHQIGSSHDSRQKPCHNPAECKQYKSNKTCHMRQHKHCQQIKYTVQNDVSCCSFPLTYKYKKHERKQTE